MQLRFFWANFTSNLFNHVLRRIVNADIDAADIFADKTKHHQDAATDNQNQRDNGTPTIYCCEAKQPTDNH